MNGHFIADIFELDIPDVASSRCVSVQMSNAGDFEFEAVVTSKIDSSVPVGHIRQDRYVWFT
mgnify:CR=1 FL=1